MRSSALLVYFFACLAVQGGPCPANPTDTIDTGENQAVGKSGPPLRHATRLNAGASVEDIVSNTGSCMFMGSGEKTLTALIVGNELHIKRSPDSSSTSVDDSKQWRNWCGAISKLIWTRFGKERDDVGQATLTLVVNADGSWDVLTKTIYIPDSEPFSGSQPLSKAAESFWLQVHSALSAIDDVAVPATPGVESIKFEMVIGRDEESFPRHAACGQLNIVHRNPKGGVSVGKVQARRMNVHESNN